jgi:hypothetical protein
MHTHSADMDDRYRHVRRQLKSSDADNIINSSVPILWIHVPFELNDRQWTSFLDRQNTDLNQPYLSLCVKSVVRRCDDHFRICIVDDYTFAKLLPDWSIPDLNGIAEPVRSRVRMLGMASLLREYGGLTVPISFLCLKNLMPLYQHALEQKDLFVGETVCRDVGHTHQTFGADGHFMGAKRHGDLIHQWVDFLKRSLATDHTAEPEFIGTYRMWFEQHAYIVPGTRLGTRSVLNEPITLERLLIPAANRPEMHHEMAGIWIPQQELLRRKQFDWFVYAHQRELLNGNYWLSDMFVLAFAP